MRYTILKSAGIALIFGLCTISCNDFLDEKPTSDIFSDAYFSDASHLEAYANNLYVDFLPSHTSSADYGLHGKDKDTDNQAARGRITAIRWIVGWSHNKIHRMDIILTISVSVIISLNKFCQNMRQVLLEGIKQILNSI